MVGDGGPSPNIMRTGAPLLDSNHIHVAAGGRFWRGTGIFHQSTICPRIQLSGEAPAQAAYGACAPYQFVGSDQPMSIGFQVLPPLIESCVPADVVKYHQLP